MKKTAKDERITLSILSVLAMILLLAASLTTILLDDGGVPYPFTTPHGEQVEIYGGAGPYQFDNTYKAIAFRSFDWANLVVVLPLFSAGLWLYRRGKFRGQLLLAALFTYLAYIYLRQPAGLFGSLHHPRTGVVGVGHYDSVAHHRRAGLAARQNLGLPGGHCVMKPDSRFCVL